MDNTYIKQNLKHTLLEKLPIKKLGVIGLVGLTLSACNVTMGTQQSASEGIGFRQARFAEMSAMKAWRDCRDEALALDKSARVKGLAAQYLASAKAIEACEANTGPEISGLNQEERMRTMAIASLNFLRVVTLKERDPVFKNSNSTLVLLIFDFPTGLHLPKQCQCF